MINRYEVDYIKMLHSRLIRNCPITPQSVTITNTILGPDDIAALKGKTTSKSSETVVTDYVKIPQRILELKKEVTLEAYLMFLSGIGFFIGKSQWLKFTTIDYLQSRTKGKFG